MKQKQQSIAYFSMEIAINDKIPNFAGGLGVLAGDTLFSCAESGIDIVGVSLVYHQDDDPEKGFDTNLFMKKRDETIEILIEDRKVKIVIWQMDIKGSSGHIVPIFFLSTYAPENAPWDRDLTKYLYAADRYTRLGQETILGIGGVRALDALGYKNISTFHMNEGHPATLTLELLKRHQYNSKIVRSLCTFTTHTPISAGHDYFDYSLAYKTLGRMLPMDIKKYATENKLGMTELALNLSRCANSVSRKHQSVSSSMFPHHDFEYITNGIYPQRWIGLPMEKLLNKHFENWQEKPALLKNAPKKISNEEIKETHQEQKTALIEWINKQKKLFPFEDTNENDLFSGETLTICFARRYVPYKRHTLVFNDIETLKNIGSKKIQLVFAGRCHPSDQFCNNIENQINNFAKQLRGEIKIVVLRDYNLEIAKRMLTGCDIWLNNPVPPQEASGTSGMKAALNGGLNLSILDGWWIEGLEMDPLAGWGFGDDPNLINQENRDAEDAKQLYQNIEKIIDCYYNNKPQWLKRMKHAISLISFFNTHRLVNEYKKKIWNKK